MAQMDRTISFETVSKLAYLQGFFDHPFLALRRALSLGCLVHKMRRQGADRLFLFDETVGDELVEIGLFDAPRPSDRMCRLEIPPESEGLARFLKESHVGSLDSGIEEAILLMWHLLRGREDMSNVAELLFLNSKHQRWYRLPTKGLLEEV